MLEDLKEKVYKANMELKEKKLVIYTWGNVSGIDKKSGYFVIKPSGVPYEKLEIKDMVVMDLEGNVIEGNMRPSSDTPTHMELYKNFPDIGGIVHTHSPWAVTFAQAGLDIPVLGTTHADYFYKDIPCTREMSDSEINNEYEKQTGSLIVETFKDIKINVMDTPAVLVKNHGPFVWGHDAEDAVYHSVVLEKIAEIAYHTMILNPVVKKADKILIDKHYLRKHGANAYYGQN